MSYFLIFYLTISLLGFFLSGALLWQIVRMVHWNPLYNFVQLHRQTIWTIYFGMFGAIPTLSILSYLWSNFIYNPLLSLVYLVSVWGLSLGGYLMAASFISWFIALVFMFIQHIKHIGDITLQQIVFPFSPTFSTGQKILIILPIIMAILIVIYGTINASTIRVLRTEVSASSGAYPLPASWIGKNIVMYSDTHIGTIRGKAFLSRVVEQINDADPYITIMAGDLIDGPRFPHDRLKPLANLRSTLGNYYTPGNHEEYSRDMEMSSIIDQYLTRVSDDVTTVDGVGIIGMSYHREALQTLTDRVSHVMTEHPEILTLPKIGILHDPKNINALLDLKPNLTVSGHTHGGQLWPGTIAVKKIYGIFGYGPSYHNDNQTLHITSSGVGSAQSPVRIGTRAEIVVIRVVE